VSSNLSNGSSRNGSVAEWSKAADCKSAGVTLRWFKSIPAHIKGGSSSVGRASAFQAEGRGFESLLPLKTAYIAQAVEHFLGKEEVTSSSLVVGP
jgi:hypothetical protein